jgi:hypothetical protein
MVYANMVPNERAEAQVGWCGDHAGVSARRVFCLVDGGE